MSRGVEIVRRAERKLRKLVRGEDVERLDGLCRSAPEWLVMCINNFCNLHCKMCDVGLGETDTPFYLNLVGRDPRNMSTELFEGILDQAARFRPPPRIGLAFTEPLLHARVVDFVGAIAERGLEGAVTTNGYLLPQLAQALVESGLDEITLSVDGPREVHNRIRGSRDSFERIYEGVQRVKHFRRLRRGALPKVHLSYTITDENYTDMLAFVREVEPLRPEAISFSHLNFITSEMAAVHNHVAGASGLAVSRSNLGTMDLEGIDFDALWEALAELKAHVRRFNGWRTTIVPDFGRREAVERFYREPLNFVGGRRCTDPWKMMMVQTDGTVIPAHGRCYHFPVGRVPDETLQDIWNGPRLSGFRRLLSRSGGSLPACARCCGVIGKAED